MTSHRALELLRLLDSAGIRACLDGGWGIDALLGRQTREHDDLDLVVALEDVNRIQQALAGVGFSLVGDHLPVRFVMRNPQAEQLDFHTVTFNEAGEGIQPQPDGSSFSYPAEGFVEGRIAGQPVLCVSAGVQILCHLGYEPKEKDVRDVMLLCRTFGLAVPATYRGTDRD